jgi:peptidyl-prolyl cis-trans isomerase D
MLQSMRDNSQGIVAKIIVGLIIVTFALFGVESLVSLTGGSDAPATVNGQEITQQELYQATQIQRRQILEQMGENVDPTQLDDNLISGMVLEGLIQQTALLQSAEDQGMYVSDQMLDQMIVTQPSFQTDGTFNPDQFKAVLRSVGYTPITYREMLRKEQTLNQASAGFELSSFVVPAQIDQLASIESQTRSGQYVIFDQDMAAALQSITPEQVQARYDQEKDNLMTPEQVVVQYLLLDKATMRDNVEVTEEQLQSAYQQYQASFTPDDQYHVAHILVEISNEVSDDQAREKAQSLKSEIDSGADFAQVAKDNSDDIGSSQQGGDLGEVKADVFTEPFTNALTALEVGQVSEPVRTEFGYHLIKLIDKSKSTAEPFVMVKEQLESDLIEQSVNEEYVTALEQLKDSSFSAGDLAEPSELLGLPIQTSKAFDRVGGDDPVTSNAKVVEAAFSSEVMNDSLNSNVIDLNDDQAVVVRVKDHFEPKAQTLEEVEADLRAQLAQEAAESALNEKVSLKLAAIKEGQSINDVAEGKTVEFFENLSRSAGQLPEPVADTAFALAHPQSSPVYGQAQMGNGSIAIVELTAVQEGTEAEQAPIKEMLAPYLSGAKGKLDYQMVSESVKERAEIER